MSFVSEFQNFNVGDWILYIFCRTFYHLAVIPLYCYRNSTFLQLYEKIQKKGYAFKGIIKFSTTALELATTNGY